MSEEVEAHILKKYDLLVRLGKGAYGIVWKAVDKQTKKVVALKKVFDAFHNATDAQRTFREVMFLQELKGHDNIVALQGLIKAENNKDIYLVFDFMDTDLHVVIRGNILEEVHRQFVIYQILKAIKYMHSGGIIHRDLKPSNVLLDQECLVKVADFGLARSIAQQCQDTIMTEYVATRWYRAPQILLGSSKYTKAVDMWSIGCILAQMFLGKALFPGNSTLNQISKVLEVVGRPSRQDIESMQSNLAQQCIDQITIEKKKSYNQLFPNASDSAIDLIKRLLTMNPNRRLTAQQALRHPYLKDFSSPSEEIQCSKIIQISMDDNTKFSIREYRQALYNEIIKKKKEQDQIRRNSFQKQQQQIARQQKIRRNHQAILKQRQQYRKPQRRDVLKYEKQNNKYRDYEQSQVSKQRIGVKPNSSVSRCSQKPFIESSTNTRVQKSKTFYVSEKDYKRMGNSNLDKSIGQPNNPRKSQNMYGRVNTSNYPYRKK